MDLCDDAPRIRLLLMSLIPQTIRYATPLLFDKKPDDPVTEDETSRAGATPEIAGVDVKLFSLYTPPAVVK